MGVEQPVAVCPECGGTTEKPQCIVSHAPYQHTQLMYHEPNQHDCTVCSNLFHSNTEQGSHYDKCKVCGYERQFIDGKWHHLKGDGPCVEPTAQTVAGDPQRCKTCASKLCEDCESDGQCCGCEDMKVIADLRRQLAERDAVIESIRKVMADPERKVESGTPLYYFIQRLEAKLSAHPSTILGSVRQEERERLKNYLRPRDRNGSGISPEPL